MTKKQKIEEKDISKCYGLLADYKEDLKFIEKEANKTRKYFTKS